MIKKICFIESLFAIFDLRLNGKQQLGDDLRGVQVKMEAD